MRQQLNLPNEVKGAAIQSVRPGSPAEDAGLQPGDIIVQVNSQDVDSASQAVNSVRAVPAGQDVLLLVWSNGGEGYRVPSSRSKAELRLHRIKTGRHVGYGGSIPCRL